MINANELRIGNLIQTETGKIKRVENVFGDRFNLKFVNGEPMSDPLTEMESIPLAPEILKKCGLADKQILGFEFYFNGKGECVLTNEHGNSVIIHSLHQLQNLYFALTGNELEINL